MNELDKKIQNAKDELAKLEGVKAEINSLRNDKRLAIRLHACLCHYNHTDACGWHYEKDTDPKAWLSNPRSDYLRRAQSLIARYGTSITCEHIAQIVEIAGTSQFKG